MVRGYAFPQDIMFKRQLIKCARNGAEKAFGDDGIIPIARGGVQIIPAFKNPEYVKEAEKPTLEVCLLEKPERTLELIEAVKKEFKIAMGNRFVVKINLQPEELFVTY